MQNGMFEVICPACGEEVTLPGGGTGSCGPPVPRAPSAPHPDGCARTLPTLSAGTGEAGAALRIAQIAPLYEAVPRPSTAAPSGSSRRSATGWWTRATR